MGPLTFPPDRLRSGERGAGVEKALKGIMVFSTILMLPGVVYQSKACLPQTSTWATAMTK